MGKQKHDIGWTKRQPRNRPEPIQSGGKLARELVERGLASPNILDAQRMQDHKHQPSDNNR